jgi:hypothetical protein
MPPVLTDLAPTRGFAGRLLQELSGTFAHEAHEPHEGLPQ